MNEDKLVNALNDAAADDQVRWAQEIWDGRAPDTAAFGQRLAAVMLLAVMDGAGGPVVERHGLLSGLGKAFSVVFTEAMDKLKSKPTIGVISPRDLDPVLRQTAFFVSGVTAGNIVDEIKKEMVRVRGEGGSLSDFIQAVRDMGVQRTGAQIETIWRTNIGMAAEAGRFQQFNNPRWLAFEYRSQRDKPTTRPLHAAMNGFIAAKDDPIWRIIWPLNGYNCRCGTLPLSQSDIAGKRLADREGNLRQSRFYANRLQEDIVDAAEANFAIMVDGKPTKFPDEGFRGNALAGLIA